MQINCFDYLEQQGLDHDVYLQITVGLNFPQLELWIPDGT